MHLAKTNFSFVYLKKSWSLLRKCFNIDLSMGRERGRESLRERIVHTQVSTWNLKHIFYPRVWLWYSGYNFGFGYNDLFLYDNYPQFFIYFYEQVIWLTTSKHEPVYCEKRYSPYLFAFVPMTFSVFWSPVFSFYHVFSSILYTKRDNSNIDFPPILFTETETPYLFFRLPSSPVIGIS